MREDSSCVWKRLALVAKRWRHLGWEILRGASLGREGCFSEYDVYSEVANYLNRHPEIRALFGSVVAFSS